MSDTQFGPKKRKRASAACFACHHRKVRCNIINQGVPCSNCQQDGAHCELYRRPIGLPIQGGSTSTSTASLTSAVSPSLYPEPSVPSSTRDISIRGITEGGTFDDRIAQSTPYPHHNFIAPLKPLHDLPSHATNERVNKEDYMPYYAGESEGLEFLFDQTNPDRRDRGPHYLTPRRTYRRKPISSSQGARRLAPRLPTRHVQQELVKTFFHYVWPLMPVIDAREFLEAFEKDWTTISPLLLWSVFFSALSYIDDDLLRKNKLKPRKLLKENYYQNAKNIYDRQEEEDKTVLIQSTLLLSSWYVDYDDRDGSWYWSGTAISLCHTIGLHRASIYARMTPVPFSARLRCLWRRIWWSCFFRETWLAMGFGRPVRIQFDDCDEELPTKSHIMDELGGIPNHLRERYLPPDIDILVESWLVLVSLGVTLNEILTMHYRPRSKLPVPSVLLKQETEILKLRALLPATTSPSTCAIIHGCHVGMYFNSVLIALYRLYLSCHPDLLRTQEEIACRQHSSAQAKVAAADNSSQLNKLLGMDAIDHSPSSFMAATMGSMQILIYEYRNADLLRRGYARNGLAIHLLALQHLRKTYWGAEVQFTLFKTCLKVLERELGVDDEPHAPRSDSRIGDMGPPRQSSIRSEPSEFDRSETESFSTMDINISDWDAFQPFVGMPSYSDDLGPNDWEVSDSGSLASARSSQEDRTANIVR